ncbi:MAG: hypothetical protein IKS99_05245 [Firmicutes bacterium]|nr:hypothetical protein [Bacillota bacterium]
MDEDRDFIRIMIDTGDPDFDRRLGRRMAEISEGFQIEYGNGSPDEGDEDRYDVILDGNCEKGYLPVSRTVEAISDNYSRTTGKPFYRPKNGRKNTYIFRSHIGGCGLSSVAFVFSRLLTMKRGEKVLYVDVGTPGSFASYEGSESLKPVSEMIFLIRTGRIFDIYDHVVRDHFGPCVLVLERPDKDVLDAVIECSGFDSLVISLRGDVKIADAAEILLTNAKDARISESMRLEDRGIITVINREYVNKAEGDRVLIADDCLSFRNPEGRLRIAMDGEFAIGVEKLLRKVTDENGV